MPASTRSLTASLETISASDPRKEIILLDQDSGSETQSETGDDSIILLAGGHSKNQQMGIAPNNAAVQREPIDLTESPPRKFTRRNIDKDKSTALPSQDSSGSQPTDSKFAVTGPPGQDVKPDASRQPIASTSSGPILPSANEYDEDLTCSICMDLFLAPVNLACGHSFCAHCVADWLRAHENTCPVCRAKSGPPARAIIIEGIVEKTVRRQADYLRSCGQEEEARKFIEERQGREETIRQSRKTAAEAQKRRDTAALQEMHRTQHVRERYLAQQRAQNADELFQHRAEGQEGNFRSIQELLRVPVQGIPNTARRGGQQTRQVSLAAAVRAGDLIIIDQFDLHGNHVGEAFLPTFYNPAEAHRIENRTGFFAAPARNCNSGRAPVRQDVFVFPEGVEIPEEMRALAVYVSAHNAEAYNRLAVRNRPAQPVRPPGPAQAAANFGPSRANFFGNAAEAPAQPRPGSAVTGNRQRAPAPAQATPQPAPQGRSRSRNQPRVDFDWTAGSD